MKKLSLNRETIRNLDERDLERVHGGDQRTTPPECNTHDYCASAHCQIYTGHYNCFHHTMEC